MGPAMDGAESAASLKRLSDIQLPNATKYVVTVAKFDPEGVVKTFRADGEYDVAPPHLQTLAAWAELPSRSGPRFRDGFDLFCLRALLSKGGAFDYAVVFREGTFSQTNCSELIAVLDDKPFKTFHAGGSGVTVGSGRNIILNLASDTTMLLDLAWQLHVSGVAYAMIPYSLDRLMTVASDTLQLMTVDRDELPELSTVQPNTGFWQRFRQIFSAG